MARRPSRRSEPEHPPPKSCKRPYAETDPRVQTGRPGFGRQGKETVHLEKAEHARVGIAAGELRQGEYDDDVKERGADEAHENGEENATHAHTRS